MEPPRAGRPVRAGRPYLPGYGIVGADEGTAEVVTDMKTIKRFLGRSNEKYQTSYTVDFLDPAVNATVAVQPRWVFGLRHDDFSGSPTRWVFDEGAGSIPAARTLE